MSAGGLCLHFDHKEEKDKALKDWPEGAFGSPKVQPHCPARLEKSTTCFSHAPTYLPTDKIALHIQEEHHFACSVRRLKDTYTLDQLPVVKITTATGAEASQLIEKGFAGRRFTCTPKKTIKTVRCYHCQKVGHIAELPQRHCVHSLQPKSRTQSLHRTNLLCKLWRESHRQQ